MRIRCKNFVAGEGAGHLHVKKMSKNSVTGEGAGSRDEVSPQCSDYYSVTPFCVVVIAVHVWLDHLCVAAAACFNCS